MPEREKRAASRAAKPDLRSQYGNLAIPAVKAAVLAEKHLGDGRRTSADERRRETSAAKR